MVFTKTCHRMRVTCANLVCAYIYIFDNFSKNIVLYDLYSFCLYLLSHEYQIDTIIKHKHTNLTSHNISLSKKWGSPERLETLVLEPSMRRIYWRESNLALRWSRASLRASLPCVSRLGACPVDTRLQVPSLGRGPAFVPVPECIDIRISSIEGGPKRPKIGKN